MTAEPMFPIMNDPIIKALPWAALTPHDKQAQANHGGQNLKVLAGRGGLGITEAYHILRDERYPFGQKHNLPLIRVALMRLVAPPPAPEAAL